VLPDFHLKTIPAIQNPALLGQKPKFNDWFDALDYLKEQIAESDFDIALLGCGAYGFPLAAFVKKLGKQAIHLGGASQLLFGIKGERWERTYPNIAKLFNEYWVYPSPEETPKNAHWNENGWGVRGAYW
jgi:hypothetical protein